MIFDACFDVLGRASRSSSERSSDRMADGLTFHGVLKGHSGWVRVDLRSCVDVAWKNDVLTWSDGTCR